MAIIFRLDRVMVDRKTSLKKLAEEIGMTSTNLSRLKNGKINSIRFETMDKICKILKCQPGDLFEYTED